MAAILQKALKCFEKECINFDQIALKSVPNYKGALDNKLTFVQVTAWCQIGNKRFPESVLTKISEVTSPQC